MYGVLTKEFVNIPPAQNDSFVILPGTMVCEPGGILAGSAVQRGGDDDREEHLHDTLAIGAAMISHDLTIHVVARSMT